MKTTMTKPTRYPIFRVVVCLGLMVACIAPAAAAVAQPKAQCEAVTIKPAARWTAGGAWGRTAAGDVFVLLDAADRSFLRYADRGRVVSPRGDQRAGTDLDAMLDFLTPREVWPLEGGGMVVETLDSLFMSFASDLLPNSGLRDLPEEVGLQRLFPYRWGVSGDSLSDGGLVVCGEVLAKGTETWQAGLFYLPLSGESRGYQTLKTFDWSAPERQACRLGGQPVAAVDGTAYVLVQEPQPKIYRVAVTKAGEASLQSLALNPRPDAMRGRPLLPTLSLKDEYGQLMAEVTRSHMAVELAGWKGHLYLLMRKPDNGTTIWSLARIDPATGEVKSTFIDSAAAHLSMVFGPQGLALVEKAPPASLTDQAVVGWTLIPGGLLRSLGERKTLCP